ncbi:MAG TPA: NAD-dependent epimerase/dehydratase family protein [Candidatus Dormibacteraeota bacterium]|nr:NAD-dependent epimerase/dehydratase family protein [Candidatus Dormibacteraeota bacterium]
MTALVTGGAGFIGRALVARLADQGERVVVLDNLLQFRDRQPPELPAELVVGDVRDRAFVLSLLERVRPEAVYHLAAIHFIPACEADPGECISVNTAGAAAVLEACSKLAPSPACVLASTGAVYAPAQHAHREEETPGPVDVYGLSKLWMEQIGELFAKRDGLRVAVARLFNTYGPGETNPHLIPAVIDQVMAGGRLRVGNIDTRRDYVHVDDVAQALAAMAGRTETLNVGSGRAISGHEVIAAVGRAVGRPLEVETDASRLRKVDRPLLLSDPSRAADVLGWRAEMAFDQGIADLVSGVRV